MLTRGKSAPVRHRLQIVAEESQTYQAIDSSDTAISKITHIPMKDYHFQTVSENMGQITEN
ncbi:hypothetical protein [Mastigocladopsis repens]|uniref:hypothetical protein n=1 Tax=Mastigocladopsis repens TaxID=221287 RepID=UPI0003135887|nr:hypothetical protein [Mastigocladopsis repens]